MSTKTKQTGIRKKQKFYNWCVKNGLDVSKIEVERINFEANKPESSFKKRASEVKATLNYIFKFREQDFLNDFPNVESIDFVPVLSENF
jgi:hypothetical protein